MGCMSSISGLDVLDPATYVLSFLRKAPNRGTSAAILFLDAEAAYYITTRSAGSSPLAAAVAIFERFQIPPDDVHLLMEEVLAGSMDLGVPQTVRHMANSVSALHTA